MKVELKWLNCNVVDFEDKPDENHITVIQYGDGTNILFYYNMERKKVIELFDRLMYSRSSFEVDDEGWKAKALEIPLRDNWALMVDIQGQFQRMVKTLFKDV